MRLNLKTAILFGLILLSVAIAWPKAESTAAAPIMQSVTWQGDDFVQGGGVDTAVSPTGLTLADGAMAAVYTSEPIPTISFNALVTSWEAAVPVDTSMTIQVRTRQGSGDWSDWFYLDTSLDLVEEDDHENLSDMITVPAADVTHNTVQFSVGFGRFDVLATPNLSEISFTLIDTTNGPTTSELLARQQELDAASGDKPSGGSYPRPTVISREVWCTSVDCDYTDGLEYDDASHMIVHHTVSSNSSSDWAATVRAIWAFHTYPASSTCTSCRGWGDIGYNYLIDQTGVIYEGHLNEDYDSLDVVGTHAGGANSGSMGVSLIGTFTAVDYPGLPGIAPPEAMKASLVELLSWKADQRDINVYNSDATMPNVYGGRPNLMGHRDAYGTTECPGDQAHVLLPWLRDQVAANIGLVDPYSYVDELSGQFTRSNATWLEGSNECGHNGHSYYTFSTTNPANSTNWGIWRPEISEFGYYRIEMYVPYCFTGTGETDGATYEISHYNGLNQITLSHEQGIGQWNHLGNFVLGSAADEYVYLDDLVTTDDGLGVWFDGLRFVRLPDPEDNVTLLDPSADIWINGTQIALQWQLTSLNSIESVTVEVGTDPDLTNIIFTETWNTAVTSYTFNYIGDVTPLYWRTTAVFRQADDSLNTASSPIGQFKIDREPPTSGLTAVYQTTSNPDRYVLFWTGSDALSSVASYTIDYRPVGSSTWTTLQANIAATSSPFNAPEAGQQYEFRLRATDVAGNSQPDSTPPDPLGTQQAILLSHAIMLPMITR